jgi:hypothetical protein
VSSMMEEAAAKKQSNRQIQGEPAPSFRATDDFAWEEMTLDEYAQQEAGMGFKLRQVDGMWWRQIRPFFYRPLFPFSKFEPGRFPPPRRSWLAGYHHLVPSEQYANSEMRLMVFDDVPHYSLDQLPQPYRKNTRKGLSHFEFRRINNFKEFLTEGFKVYMSFYERTGWAYQSERTKPEYFRRWAKGVFSAPKTAVWGAYKEGQLRGVTISFRVENVIISPTYFADSEALRLRVSEAMLHFLRTQAAEASGTKYVYMGMAGSKDTLDDYKASRGCRVLTLPAYTWLNPAVAFVTKYFRKQDYQRLFLKAAGASSLPCLVDNAIELLEMCPL